MGTNQTPPAGGDNAANQELFGKQRPKTTQLEILEALHTANFNRWDKRRNYEWLLSYAVWGALGGFLAIVVFGKDSQFRAPERQDITIVILVLGTIAHAVYLFFMINNTVRDLKSQKLIESKICGLLDDAEFGAAYLRAQDFPEDPQSEPVIQWKDRYGLVGQILITIILCLTAYWAISQKAQGVAASPVITPGYVCEGCIQVLSSGAAGETGKH